MPQNRSFFLFFFGAPGLSPDVWFDGTGEVGCLYQVLSEPHSFSANAAPWANKGSAKCQQGQCKGPTRAVQSANKGSAKRQQGQCKVHDSAARNTSLYTLQNTAKHSVEWIKTHCYHYYTVQNTLLYYTIQNALLYYTVQNALLYYTIQNALLYYTVKNALLYYTVQSALLYYTVQSALLYYTVQSALLNYTVLSALLCYTVQGALLYYTVQGALLHHTVQGALLHHTVQGALLHHTVQGALLHHTVQNAARVRICVSSDALLPQHPAPTYPPPPHSPTPTPTATRLSVHSLRVHWGRLDGTCTANSGCGNRVQQRRLLTVRMFRDSHTPVTAVNDSRQTWGCSKPAFGRELFKPSPGTRTGFCLPFGFLSLCGQGVRCAQNVRRDGSSFTWHQTCNNQTALSSTQLRWIFETRCEKLVTHLESHVIRAQ